MSKSSFFILLLIFIILFSNAAYAFSVDEKQQRGVTITSQKEGGGAIMLSTLPGKNVSILYPDLTIDIWGNVNDTWKILLGDENIAHGNMTSVHIQVHILLNETKNTLRIYVADVLFDFGVVVIKKHLTSKDIGDILKDYIEITQEEYTWARWQAGLGAFIGAIMSLPIAYVIVKIYLDKRGEYAT